MKELVPQVVEDAPDVVRKQPNLFLPLVPEAYTVLRRALHNANEKISVQTAKDVLSFAGQIQETPKETSRPIIIKDSQVQLLLKVVQESVE